MEAQKNLDGIDAERDQQSNYTKMDINFLDQRKSVESLQKFIDEKSGIKKESNKKPKVKKNNP